MSQRWMHRAWKRSKTARTKKRCMYCGEKTSGKNQFCSSSCQYQYRAGLK